MSPAADVKNRVYISLCSYNGEEFLSDQLESIVSQSEENWSLLARDDHSVDSSNAILNDFHLRDSRMSLSDGAESNLGAKGNFSYLLERMSLSTSSYFALSDQDDVWVKSKLSKQLRAMIQAESTKVRDQPILIYSDLEVVDASLDCIASSLMQYQNIQHERLTPLNVLLTQNFVTGCTILMNKRLLNIVLPIPEEALMHDWWIALCAAVFGDIEYIDEPLVKYRQHGKNEVGAKHIVDFMNPLSGKWKKRWYEGRENLFQSMKQAQALADRIREHDPDNPNLALVEEYASLYGMSPVKRIQRLHDLGVHAQSGVRQMLLLSRLLLTPRDYNG